MQKKAQVKTAKGRKSSSTRWLYRHINDPYVATAQECGYRSRAAFKLIEIDDKFKVIPSTGITIDLGCAPGSWLQVLSKRSKGESVGVDLKAVDCNDLPNATTIVGDFTDDETIRQLNAAIANKNIKLVLSDMAPNACGDKQTDHIRIIFLAQQVLDFIRDNCSPGANAVIKIIQGNLGEKLRKEAESMFSKVHWYKPKSSYSDSAEIYLIMLNLK